MCDWRIDISECEDKVYEIFHGVGVALSVLIFFGIFYLLALRRIHDGAIFSSINQALFACQFEIFVHLIYHALVLSRVNTEVVEIFWSIALSTICIPATLYLDIVINSYPDSIFDELKIKCLRGILSSRIGRKLLIVSFQFYFAGFFIGLNAAHAALQIQGNLYLSSVFFKAACLFSSANFLIYTVTLIVFTYKFRKLILEISFDSDKTLTNLVIQKMVSNVFFMAVNALFYVIVLPIYAFAPSVFTDPASAHPLSFFGILMVEISGGFAFFGILRSELKLAQLPNPTKTLEVEVQTVSDQTEFNSAA